ncbi:MAG: hypothetical protein ACRD6W_01600, partial [Nitrososphaerales archaeon]
VGAHADRQRTSHDLCKRTAVPSTPRESDRLAGHCLPTLPITPIDLLGQPYEEAGLYRRILGSEAGERGVEDRHPLWIGRRDLIDSSLKTAGDRQEEVGITNGESDPVGFTQRRLETGIAHIDLSLCKSSEELTPDRGVRVSLPIEQLEALFEPADSVKRSECIGRLASSK